MTVTANDLLTSLKAVHANAKCEADWRGVCGRAYYSVYQDGKAFHDGLKSPGRLAPDSEGGMHSELIERLLNPTIARNHPDFLKSLSIGSSMQTIYANRVKADYKRGLNIDKATAANSVLLAGSVISSLLPPVPAPGSGRPSLTIIK